MLTPYRVVTYGGGIIEQVAKMVQINMRSLDGKNERTQVVRSVENLCGNMQVWPWNEYKEQWEHMKNLEFPKVVGDAKIDLLIGTENTDFVRVIAPDIIGKSPQEPVVRRTAVGPIAMGHIRPWAEPINNRVNLSQAVACPSSTVKPRKEILKLESDLYWDLRRPVCSGASD